MKTQHNWIDTDKAIMSMKWESDTRKGNACKIRELSLMCLRWPTNRNWAKLDSLMSNAWYLLFCSMHKVYHTGMANTLEKVLNRYEHTMCNNPYYLLEPLQNKEIEYWMVVYLTLKYNGDNVSLKELNLYFNIMNVKLCLLNQEMCKITSHLILDNS